MNLPRLTLARAMRACALLLALAPLASASAFAGYPERPVRMMVGLQAGASTDILARKLAAGWASAWASLSSSRTGPVRARGSRWKR
ncbi:hypothetical protein [Cupriavidus nantongensis]